jgi:uncharacterized protein YndB with AHSA1/START domain
MTEVRHLIEIDAPAAAVWAALTGAEGLRRWWTSEAALDARRGGAGSFDFGPVPLEVRVEAIDPERSMVWHVVSARLGSWPDTRIAFELRPRGTSTVLSLVQSGSAAANDDVAITTTGWGFFLQSLRAYLETGTGTPFPDTPPVLRRAG